MHAVAITGFLGTGKTTLTLALAERLSAEGRRVAIVENERGGIGVDGPYLESRGLKVRELRAGCVCCELTVPLVRAVETLRDEYRPDWLLLEASGVANADALRANLRAPEIAGMAWRFVAVLDAARFFKLWDERYGLGTLIRPQVAQADLLVLSKIDTVPEEGLLATVEAVQALRPDVPLLPFADGDEECIAAIARALEAEGQGGLHSL